MSATIIDGKAIAAELRQKTAGDAVRFAECAGRRAGLAVVLVGDDPASQVYVGSKVKLTREAGMESFEHRLDASTDQATLMALVEKLDRDPAVDGILVQLPLPAHLDASAVILAIDPAKDVDGLHPENAGRLVSGMPALVPVHAARRDAPPEVGAARSHRPLGGRRRPLQPRRQADRAAAPPGERNGRRSPIPGRATFPASAGRPTC